MTFYMAGPGRKGGYVPGRDNVIDEVMRSWQEKYCTYSEVSVCVSTFNVNGRSAPPNILGWFPSDNRADFYIVGLQEMDLSIGTHIIDNMKKEIEWIECIRQSLPNPDDYIKVRSHRLVGILIVMFKLTKCNVQITEEKSNLIATGISVMGTKLGNKGGTGISVKINDSLICFINCHLAAGNGELERRNQDFRDITNLTFGSTDANIWAHDAIFWFGDLNYRLINEAPYTSDEIRAIAQTKQAHQLFQYDQLYIEKAKGRVFASFEETPPKFRPTYKFDVGTCQWDSSEKARVPAWCDRILWRKLDADTHIRQLSYESLEAVVISDHKPVRAFFALRLRKIDQQKADRLYEDAIREADRRANELLPQISLSASELDFGEVAYLEPNCRTITIKNTGKARVNLSFVPPPNKERICARWLQVTPIKYALRIDEEIQISLTVVIDKGSAWELSKNKMESLQDILVMRLEKGRDHFLICTAKYTPKVFGVSLQHLLHRNQTEQNLIDFGETAQVLDDCPDGVPKEIHRLVSALRKIGHTKLNFTEMVDNSLFGAIRTALENNVPQDLTSIRGVTAFSLYSTLLRLLDSLTESLIPQKSKEACLHHCTNAVLLWTEVAKFDPIRVAMIEYLTTYLRELVSLRQEAREQLWSWADVFFRDTSPPITPRQQCLYSLVDYARDVAVFHSSASFNTLPNKPSNERLQVRLPPPVPPHRGTSSQTIPRAGSNMF
ncbi:unnamed protein product, partial [Mesorhabditis belari]|uniref:Inositol polyphosphate-related phosphatase domain-containing protein n=1 Tax=Mesorhabditis belari TaxID=2138241 RepID=A0AAF3F4N2_9BILA